MIDNSIHQWLTRFTQKSNHITLLTTKILPINTDHLPKLCINEWDLDAIDFHCSDILTQWRTDKCEEYCKEVMWKYGGGRTKKERFEFRDSIDTRRVRIVDEDERWWNGQKGVVYKIAKGILNRVLFMNHTGNVMMKN